METKSKIFGGLLAATLLVPLVPSAAASATTSTRAIAAPANNFCTNLPTLTQQINNKISQGQATLSSKQQQRQTTLQNRLSARTQELATARNQDDADRAAINTQLMSKAMTDAQKQAVAAFENTVQAAIAARRSAVDAAIAAYQPGTQAVLADRQTAVAAAEQHFASTVQTALKTASNECAAGTAPATVRQHFATALQQAKTQFSAGRKTIDKAGPQVKALVQTRNTAVKKASDIFHAAMEQARKTLKAAFQSTTPTQTQNSSSTTAH